jgi:hypothetical protein
MLDLSDGVPADETERRSAPSFLAEGDQFGTDIAEF